MISDKFVEGGQLLPYPKLTKRDEKYLREYKYKGEDRGILNNLLFNKFYDFVVEKLLPSFIAPNTITLLGPVLVIIETILIIARYGDSADQLENGPTNKPLEHVFAAFSIYFFLTADNVDGKHARHIHLCSTLGDWLDHSLDIVSYFCIILTGIHYFSLGIGTVFMGVSVVLITYELVMWEAYVLDEMIIHEFEACSEGMVAISCFHLLSLVIDPSQRPSFVPDKFYFKMPFLVTIFGIINVLAALIALVKSINRRFNGDRKIVITSIFIHIPVVLPVLSALVWWFMFPDVVYDCHWSWTIYMCTAGMYWIYLVNVARLLGWSITLVDIVKRPFHLVLTALPWVLAPFMGPAMAIKVAGVVGTVAITYVWIVVTHSFKKSLDVSLWNVPKDKDIPKRK